MSDECRFIPVSAENTRIHHSAFRTHHFAGFIPAGAGNTLKWAVTSISIPVHPRGRGEHGEQAGRWASMPGSSPRARGTPPPPTPPARDNRFIPAGAGNTVSPTASTRVLTVHPRGRGEHAALDAELDEPVGSSPRARGTLYLRVADSPLQRFIPAGAGNTPYICSACQSACGSSPRARGTLFTAQYE